jgi:hypothetical protein
MIRRRRRGREIAFSFDSFLDVVANVVGMIIRLILVVWVGARSYTGFQLPATFATAEPAAVQSPPDPLVSELEQRRRELALVQNRLSDQLRLLADVRGKDDVPTKEWVGLDVRRHKLEAEQATLEGEAEKNGQLARAAALSETELRERSRRLMDEIKAIDKLPPVKRTFQYKTPISQPVQAEELLFECRDGRVSFIDVGGMLREARGLMRDKGEDLRSRWETEGVTEPIGAFRLHYTIERERDGLAFGSTPDGKGNFRYGMTGWVVEPISPTRGETADAALAPESDFRRIVDAVDPMTTVVTFWVYPESFRAFRRLRDYLYDREVVVAGRPLPNGAPIMASSKNGTRSRGQ